MKVEIEGAFIKPNEDVQDGDLITFLDEGEESEGKYGKKMNIRVRTPKGDEKLLSLNNTSKRNLVEHYGDESKAWIGKQAQVNVVKQLVSGEMKSIIVITAPNIGLDGTPVIE